MKNYFTYFFLITSSFVFAQAPIKFIEDTTAMKKEILSHIPIGTNIDSAQKIMERNKFAFDEGFKNETFLSNKKMDFLLFFHDEGVIFCMNRWKTALVYKNGKVSDVIVQFVIICL